MGYSTTYKGKLKVNEDISFKAFQRLRNILQEDVRDHPELAKHKGKWRDEKGNKNDWWYYVDLVFDEDDLSLRWDDNTEKSFICGDMIHAIVAYMREEFPNFTINGTLNAYGEEPGDVWVLNVVDGIATHKKPEDVVADMKSALQNLVNAAVAVVSANQVQALTTELINDLDLAAQAAVKSL